MTSSEYFAINCDLHDLMNKVTMYYDGLFDIGHTEKIQKSYHYYYGQNSRSSFLHKDGKQKQLHSIVVNDFRSIVQHVVTLVTANRPSFDVRTTNSDYTSVTQAVLGEQILEYYMRENKIEKLLKKACDYAVKYSEGFISLDWDASKGQIVGVGPDDRPYAEGDIRYSLYHPLQVIRDIYNEGKQEWVITAQKLSKYELAAQYPHKADEIMSLDNSETDAQRREIDYSTYKNRKVDSDVITFYTFYHRKCTALPEGRICMFVENAKLLDGPLPYNDIPLARLAPKDMDGTCLGYTGMWDLLGIQEATDKLYSAVVSNNITFAKQIIQAPLDNDIRPSDLAEGLMYIESDAELKVLNLVKSAPETYNLIANLQSKGQTLSGINEVIQGTPSPNLRSGNALAIIAAQAVTYNSDLSASYNMVTEDVGTLTLRFLKDFAEHPRYASIVGKYKKAFLKEFSRKDLTNVDRVTVQQKNAVLSTTAGKVELAENLLKNGVISKPEQYVMVLETGSLDPLIEPDIVEQMLIRQENEAIAEGRAPIVVVSDTHTVHIREHKAVLANIEARANPDVVAAFVKHMQEHMDTLRTTDPAILNMLGQPPVPPAAPQQMQSSAPAMEQPNQVPAMPENLPSQPSLPEGTDPTTAASYEQLQAINQGG